MVKEKKDSEFSDKAKRIRKLLGITQKEIAETLSRPPRDISQIENGHRPKQVPHDYMAFLHDKGINLNWLYDPEKKLDGDIKDVMRYAIQEGEPVAPPPVAKGATPYYLVRYDEVGKLTATGDDELAGIFNTYELPGLAGSHMPYVGFVVGKDTLPWQAEDIVICHRTEPEYMAAGAVYLVIADNTLTARYLKTPLKSRSDRTIHWVDSSTPVKEIQQIWEPLRSIVGSTRNPRGRALWE
ncbi:MAG: helix-turn-helix domain-containing protein [Cyclobacteriaceae bacterium]